MNSISNENTHMQQNEILSFKTLIAVFILFIYTISAPIIEKMNIKYIHESGMSMIVGVTVTIIAMIINPSTNLANTLYFDDAIFFNFILPPIIFSAGYNLRRRAFFKYMPYTLIYGILGTIISFVIIASITYSVYNYLNIFSLILNIQEILLFSAVISATDTLAALTFIKEESEPKLFSILFGEGIFNDAVSIVLYKIIYDFAMSKEEFSAYTPLTMLGSFAKLFILSLIFGLLIGLICTIFLKKMRYFKLHRVQECSIIIFFAYFSYTGSELIGLSPIISLLFSAMFMSHYAFYNLSFQAREESSIVSKIIANIAEAFVFTYLGLSFMSMSHTSFSISFIFVELVTVVFARYTSVYLLSFIINLFASTTNNIRQSDSGIMAFAGSIRGAIAFGLAMSIQTGSLENDEVLISTTLIMVFLTTIILGAMMPSVIHSYKIVECESSKDSKKESSYKLLPEQPETFSTAKETLMFSYSHPNNRYDLDTKSEGEELIEITTNIPKDGKIVPTTEHLHPSFFGRMKHKWNEIDNNIIKPILLNNWPQSKIDHEEISIKIRKLFNEFHQSRYEYKRGLMDRDDDEDDDERAIGDPDVCIRSQEVILNRSEKNK